MRAPFDAGVSFAQSQVEFAFDLARGGFDDFVVRSAKFPYVFEGEAMVAHRAAHEQFVFGQNVYLGGEGSQVIRL
jgi:hypothetical protein